MTRPCSWSRRVGYLAAAALVTRLPVDKLGPDAGRRARRPRPDARLARGGRGGARTCGSVRRSCTRSSWSAISRFGYGLTTIATILLCRNHFNDPADVDAGLELLASVFAASAVGFALAAVAHAAGQRALGHDRLDLALPAARCASPSCWC